MDDTFAARTQAALDIQRATAPRMDKNMSLEKARKTARDFETFFLSQSLQPMFENIQAEEPFGGGNAEKMWKSFQVDEYAKAISKRGGIGIADKVLDQMVRMQEGKANGRK